MVSGAPGKGAPLAATLVGGDDRRRAQKRAAARSKGGYSRFVVWSKVLLPVLALGLIVLVVVWPQLKTDNTFRIGFASVRLSGSADPGMDNARYIGTDDNRQPYSVTADLARVVSERSGIVALELPKADMTLKDGSWLVLSARTGRYKREENILTLDNDVNLFHDSGYELSTDQLSVNLKAGSAEGRTPVSGHGPFGELKAQGLKLTDKGRIIFFTGPAHLTLYASSGGAQTFGP